MTRVSKNRKSYMRFTHFEEHDEFIKRISKTLYYSKLPVKSCLSLPVTELAADIFTKVNSGKTLEVLDVEEANYISKNACVPPCSLVLALLYLERLKDCNPDYLQKVAPAKLFLVSLMVASKFLHDDGEIDEVYNKMWARSGHLSLAEMNKLEMDILNAIDWTVYVHNEEFWKRLQKLEKVLAYRQASKRGWFSYTELVTLFDPAHLTGLVQTILGISSICIATYAAGLITLLGSAMVASHLPGTLLSKQSESQPSRVPSYQYTPDNESSQTELEEEIETILLDSISEESEICNESYVDRSVFRQNSTFKGNGWEWIMDSVTFWLPHSSSMKSTHYISQPTNNFDRNNAYVTKTDFTIEANRFPLYADFNFKNTMRKDSVDFSLMIPSYDWKYYISYFARVSQ